MSLGYGGACELIEINDRAVTYAYGPYNLNEGEYRNSEHIYDGRIIISRDAFVEPEIHQRIHRKPNGKKHVVVKRVRKDVDYSALLVAGKIVIENSRFCWRIYPSGHGMIALRLIFRIFDSYQDTGELPERVGYNV